MHFEYLNSPKVNDLTHVEITLIKKVFKCLNTFLKFKKKLN